MKAAATVALAAVIRTNCSLSLDSWAPEEGPRDCFGGDSRHRLVRPLISLTAMSFAVNY
jgi:hypothetical protein